MLLHNFGKETADEGEASQDVKALVERLSQEQRQSIQKHETSRAQIEAMIAQLEGLFQEAVEHLESQTNQRVGNELKEQDSHVERRLQQFSARLDALHERVASFQYSPDRRAETTEEEDREQPRTRRLEVSVGFILVGGLVLLAGFVSVSLVLGAYLGAV